MKVSISYLQHLDVVEELITYLRQSLVSTDSLGAVQVAVDPGISLVEEVRLVGASSVGCRSGAGTNVRSASSTGGTTVVTVTVEPWVGSVGNARVVSAVSASGVIVTGHARATSCRGVVAGSTGGVAVAGSAMRAVSAVSTVSAVSGCTTVVAVTVDARVGSICNS